MNEPCTFCSDAISWILTTPRPALLWYWPDWGDRELKKKWEIEKLALGMSCMWWRCTSSINIYIATAGHRVGLKDLCSEAVLGFLRRRKLWLVLSGNTGNTVSICTQTKEKLCHSHYPDSEKILPWVWGIGVFDMPCSNQQYTFTHIYPLPTVPTLSWSMWYSGRDWSLVYEYKTRRVTLF